MPSAGNAGGALSSYCARGNMEAHVFMPKDAPEANQRESKDAGANLTLIDGLISDAGFQRVLNTLRKVLGITSHVILNAVVLW